MSGTRPWRQQQKPRITSDDTKFAEFTGVVNTRSRKDIGLKSLSVGDNVYISDSKKVTRRDGYRPYLTTGTVQSAYGGAGPLYVVDNGVLQHVLSPTDKRTLVSGLANAPYVWDTINNDAYFVNGTDAGIVRGDTYLPWRLTMPEISSADAVSVAANFSSFNIGKTYTKATFRICATYETDDGRESAPSEIVALDADPLTNLVRVSVAPLYARTNVYCTEADGTVYRLVAAGTAATVTFNPVRGGRELTTLNTMSLPAGVSRFAFMAGLCFAGQYVPELDQTIIWISEPFAYHLWNTAEDYKVVSGEVGVLLWNNKGILIGTTTNIYQYHDDTEELELLVNYGVISGSSGDLDAESIAYFWTQRGLCKAHPFENLTEKDVSMAPGVRATTSMVYLNGSQQVITVTQGGGDPFNARKERT